MLLSLFLLLVLMSMVKFGILTRSRAVKPTTKPLTILVQRRGFGNIQNLSNREQILSNEESQSIDARGRNWIEAQDHATLICINLHEIILTLGKTKPSDNRLWRANNCPVVLRARYDSWSDLLPHRRPPPAATDDRTALNQVRREQRHVPPV